MLKVNLVLYRTEKKKIFSSVYTLKNTLQTSKLKSRRSLKTCAKFAKDGGISVYILSQVTDYKCLISITVS